MRGEEEQPKSNFNFLERDHSSLILSIREGDSTGLKSDSSTQRKTINFRDHDSKLYVTEFIDNNMISEYFYDWVLNDGRTIMKFHSESHDDPNYQTETEPFHIHLSQPLINKDRLPNHYHKELSSILEFISLNLRIIPIFLPDAKTKRKRK
jgi:hypothetical protein